jgi:hypothetical protein
MFNVVAHNTAKHPVILNTENYTVSTHDALSSYTDVAALQLSSQELLIKVSSGLQISSDQWDILKSI